MDEGAIKNAESGRALDIFGVSEDSGEYVIYLGFCFVGIVVLACCYCHFFDPLRIWTVKRCKTFIDWLRRKPKPEPPPPPKPQAPEREHWYLNRTLAIDKQDKDELGPIGEGKGLKGGWYGAKNGGFDV